MEKRNLFKWKHDHHDKRIRCHLKQTNDYWRVDETYIKVKSQWMYLNVLSIRKAIPSIFT